MASAVNSLFGAGVDTAGQTSNSANSTAGSNAASSAPSEEVFLQLLVSQIQNQDPLNPADSTQFVTQLAQFSELEQVIGIRGDIETQMKANAAASGSNPGTTNPSATGSTTSSNPSATAATSNN
jgi:flagellar basal-body rod modification protein FlgD